MACEWVPLVRIDVELSLESQLREGLRSRV
jgi:hypothetical protein